MNRYRPLVVLCLVAMLAASALSQSSKVPTPSEFLGFEVGADRQLADYKQISAYLKKLAEVSPRVQVEALGKTTLGNDMVMAVISTPENLKNKARYQEIARKLADPRGLTQKQIDALVAEGKVIALVTCNIHSTEIGSSQMAMEWAHALATATDAETLRRLNSTILLLVPSLNPDGQIMETEWYRKYVGTKYEGGRSPRLYHQYVGHDNNRDWYMLTQKETQLVTRMVYHEWRPQVWLDEHQMGSTGPRIFMPPNSDPIAMSLNPMIFRGIDLIGMNMAMRLESKRKSGAIYGWSFDAYWPGGTRNTAWWKNTFGLLVEVASARMATPMEVSPSELSGGGKGLAEYGKKINYPDPWPGGVWRLRDIMDYDRIISDGMLEAVTNYREAYLGGVARMAQDAVAAAKPNEYYRLPTEGQRDTTAAFRLANLMRQHGVEVKAAQDGAFLIPLAQPYGRFVEEMLSVQRYPEVRLAAGAPILAPYDVTTWSLPLLMGVEVAKVKVTPEQEKNLRPANDTDRPKSGVSGEGKWLAARSQQIDAARFVNAALRTKSKLLVAKEAFVQGGEEFLAGTALVGASPEMAKLAEQNGVMLAALPVKPNVASLVLRTPRVGIYKSFLASMDEGWTRFLLEKYGFEPVSIENKQMREGKLNEQFDVILLPDMGRDEIVDGRRRAMGDSAMKYFVEMPPEYTGGIAKEGVQALKDFVANGGTLVTIADAGELVASDFNVPVRNALAGIRPEDFNCPGSLLRIRIDNQHPLGYGMPEEGVAFLESPIGYQTSVPAVDLKRYVVAAYPDDAKDVLVSGWIKGEERLQRRAALVAFEQGKGKIVMFGFRPQYRAQTEATFRLLFNAIYWGTMAPAE